LPTSELVLLAITVFNEAGNSAGGRSINKELAMHKTEKKNKRVRRLAIGMIVASAVTIGATSSSASAETSSTSYSTYGTYSAYSRGIRW
jgi:hypothetical protein